MDINTKQIIFFFSALLGTIALFIAFRLYTILVFPLLLFLFAFYFKGKKD